MCHKPAPRTGGNKGREPPGGGEGEELENENFNGSVSRHRGVREAELRFGGRGG